MKALVLLAAISTASAHALEQREIKNSHNTYTVRADRVSALEVVLSTEVTISGACNSAGLNGSFKEVAEEGWSLYKQYVGDFGAFVTEMGCSGSRKEIVSTSQKFKADEEGTVGLELIVPARYKLEFKEIR